MAGFLANVPAVLAEDGCIEYTATVDAAGFPTSKGSLGEDTFAVVEKWSSIAALQAHAASVHMAAYAAKTRPLMANQMIHVLDRSR